MFRIQSDNSMCRFYCITFIEYMVARKTLLHYTRLFSRNGLKKNDKISTLKTNTTNKEPSLDFSLKDTWSKRHLLEEIKQCTDKNHKKTSRNLNYVEHLLILASVITVRVSISAFASLLGISGQNKGRQSVKIDHDQKVLNQI